MNILGNPSDGGTHDRHEELGRAKRAFAAHMMSNPTFFALIVRRIGQEGHMFHGFSADQITYEPTYRPIDENRVQIGVRLNPDRSWQPEDIPALHIGMAIFDYMQLAVLDLSNAPGELDAADASTMAEIRAMQDPQLPTADAWESADNEAIELIETWQGEWNGIIRQFKGEVTLEPYSHTIGLKSDMRYDVAIRREPDSQWN